MSFTIKRLDMSIKRCPRCHNGFAFPVHVLSAGGPFAFCTDCGMLFHKAATEEDLKKERPPYVDTEGPIEFESKRRIEKLKEFMK